MIIIIIIMHEAPGSNFCCCSAFNQSLLQLKLLKGINPVCGHGDLVSRADNTARLGLLFLLLLLLQP
jgi:hypothetical protein